MTDASQVTNKGPWALCESLGPMTGYGVSISKQGTCVCPVTGNLHEYEVFFIFVYRFSRV
jgi:hypothetical protein